MCILICIYKLFLCTFYPCLYAVPFRKLHPSRILFLLFKIFPIYIYSLNGYMVFVHGLFLLFYFYGALLKRRYENLHFYSNRLIYLKQGIFFLLGTGTNRKKLCVDNSTLFLILLHNFFLFIPVPK